MRRLVATMASAALAVAMCVPLAGRISAAVAVATPPRPTSGTIVNGVAWNDTAGNYISAHLGSAFSVGSTYYWCGAPWNPNDDDSAAAHGFYGIRCYSSSNLATWTDEGTALAADTSANPNRQLTPDRHIERPKVVYNAASGQYVMWFHDASSNYGEWKIGVATSKTPTGPYTWVSDSDPAGYRGCGTGTGDMSLYQDSGAGYFVHTTTGNADVVIQQLSADYLHCASTAYVAKGLGPGREAPQLVRVNGTYFLFESRTNWWSPSQGSYRTAASLSGPWSAETNFGSAITADSQGDDILPVIGTQATTYVMLADRLQGSASGDHHWNVDQSQYVWLPLSFSGTTVGMDYLQSWSIDTATGLWWSADPQACDLSQMVDFETGTADNVGGEGARVLTPQAGSWQVTDSAQPTGNATNRIYQHTSTEGAYSFENVTRGGANVFQNYYVQAFASRTTAATQVSVEGRFDPVDHNHYYALTLGGSGWAISLNNGGRWSTLAGGPSYSQMAAPTWYLMRLVMDGPHISGWISTDKGLSFTELGSATDSTLSEGTFAVASAGGPASFDSISACVISPRTTPIPRATVTTLNTTSNPQTWPAPATVTATVTALGSPVTTGVVAVSWPGATATLLLPVNAHGQVNADIPTLGASGDLPIGTTAVTATYTGTPFLMTSQASVDQQVVYPAPVVADHPTPGGSGAYLNLSVTPSAVTLSGNNFDRAPVIQALDRNGTVLATHLAVSSPHFDTIWIRPTSWLVPLPGDVLPFPRGTASFRVTVPFESEVLTESLAGLVDG